MLCDVCERGSVEVVMVAVCGWSWLCVWVCGEGGGWGEVGERGNEEEGVLVHNGGPDHPPAMGVGHDRGPGHTPAKRVGCPRNDSLSHPSDPLMYVEAHRHTEQY